MSPFFINYDKQSQCDLHVCPAYLPTYLFLGLHPPARFPLLGS